MARIKKQDFLMLAEDHVPEKHGYLGFYFSEKLDGMRCLWDGGVSRGKRCTDVPYANTTKHERYRNVRFATGLWTRYGQPIYAPDWFLNQLPKYVPLDGELWGGRGNHQATISRCKSLDPMDMDCDGLPWEDIKYMVFDAPCYKELFANRTVNNSFFKKEFWSIGAWLASMGVPESELNREPEPFYLSLGRLKLWQQNWNNLVVSALEQTQLPSSQPKAKELIEQHLNAITDAGGEGLILRNSTSFWKPERTNDLLKVKKLHDMEVQIVGYRWADLTDMDKSLTGNATNKLRGLMGSMTVQFPINRDLPVTDWRKFDLGVGFTEEERRVRPAAPGVVPEYIPNGVIPDDCELVHFTRGDWITVRYRELTVDGIPKEARHWRKRMVGV